MAGVGVSFLMMTLSTSLRCQRLEALLDRLTAFDRSTAWCGSGAGGRYDRELGWGVGPVVGWGGRWFWGRRPAGGGKTWGPGGGRSHFENLNPADVRRPRIYEISTHR